MVRRRTFGEARCPVARSLDCIGDWWTLLIVRDTLRGPRRFGDLVASLGLARNILSSRLRKLVEQGILEQSPVEEHRGHFEYRLTEKGRALQVVVTALRQWGEDHLFDEGEAVSVQTLRSGSAAIERLAVRSAEGRRLEPDDVLVTPGRIRAGKAVADH